MGKLPFFDETRYLFAYFIGGLILFIFGGVTGIVNASYSLNNVVHNTAWLPGHFHMTVAGPVFLGIVGMSLYLYSTMSGKKVFMRKVATIIPYLWVIGMLIFSFGMSWGGLRGEPRRTNLGTSYLNPDNDLFRPDWVPTTTLALLGGIIMFIAGMLFIVVFFGMSNTSTSYATASVQTNQMIKLINVPKTARGVLVVGLTFFHWLYIRAQSKRGIHDPTIRRAAPK